MHHDESHASKWLLLLLLRRSEPDGGLLGRLFVIARVWSLRHDVAADRHQAERTAIGG